MARIAWEKITSPKKHGGLGIRNLALWNRTCTIKLLWLLLFKPESIWVAWIQDNVIKNKSIWEIQPRQSHTWIFKRILAERTTILQWIRIYPGDGTDINFWHDPWTKFGQLLFLFGQNGPRQTCIPITLHLRWLAIGSMVHGTSALLDHSIWRTSSLISPPSPLQMSQAQLNG